MFKDKLNKAKVFAKKYHLDYVAMAAGGIAVGALMYKLHLDHLNPTDCDSAIGVEPYFIDGETPGIRCNIYNLLEDGREVLAERLIFDRERFLKFDKLALECLEAALKVKAENE